MNWNWNPFKNKSYFDDDKSNEQKLKEYRRFYLKQWLKTFKKYLMWNQAGSLGYVFKNEPLYDKFIKHIAKYCSGYCVLTRNESRRYIRITAGIEINHNRKIDEAIVFYALKDNHLEDIDVILLKGNNNMSDRLKKDENKLATAQNTIKNVKKDIKKLRTTHKSSKDYLVLAMYDNLDTNGRLSNVLYYDFYVARDVGNGLHISDMTYDDIMNTNSCWFDKSTAYEILHQFRKGYYLNRGDVLNKRVFIKRFDEHE